MSAEQPPEAAAQAAGRTLVVLPFYNQANLAVQAVRALVDSGFALADVLVVDDGSEPQQVDGLREALPGLRVDSQQNRGFGAAVNRGVRSALERGYPFTLVLNTDAIITGESVRKLEGFLAQEPHARVGACAPIIYEAGSVAFAGGYVDKRGWAAMHVRTLDDPSWKSAPGTLRAPYLTGCVLMCRNAALAEVGFFSEEFFMYWEDVDLSLRLQAAGWELAVVPEVRVDHLNGGSSGGEGSVFCTYYEGRNRFLMWRRHGRTNSRGFHTLWPVLGPLLGAMVVRHPRLATPFRLSVAHCVLHGLLGVTGKQPLVSAKTVHPPVAFLMWLFGLPLRVFLKVMRALERPTNPG